MIPTFVSVSDQILRPTKSQVLVTVSGTLAYARRTEQYVRVLPFIIVDDGYDAHDRAQDDTWISQISSLPNNGKRENVQAAQEEHAT